MASCRYKQYRYSSPCYASILTMSSKHGGTSWPLTLHCRKQPYCTLNLSQYKNCILSTQWHKLLLLHFIALNQMITILKAKLDQRTNGFIWLRTRTSSEQLWTRWSTSGFHKRRWNSCVPEQLFRNKGFVPRGAATKKQCVRQCRLDWCGSD